MKLSSFLIAITILGLFSAVFTHYYLRVTEDSGVSFDNQTFSNYEQFQQLEAEAADINTTLKSIKNTEDPGAFGFASAFIASGWKLLKTTFTSLDIFTTISQQAIDHANLGENQRAFQTAFWLVILFLFAFGVVSLLLARDA